MNPLLVQTVPGSIMAQVYPAPIPHDPRHWTDSIIDFAALSDEEREGILADIESVPGVGGMLARAEQP